MDAYLVDHPPARSQYRKPRREPPSGVLVIHTAESTPDYVGFDGGAEAVARFIEHRDTPGSYHDLVDSGGIFPVVPYEWEAFHDGTGSNRHALSISFATRADVWPLAPKEWRDGAIEHGARAAVRQAAWIKARTGVVVPATRITRDESDRKVPGFISHAQRDPKRRTDPGQGFPWSQFLARYSALVDGTPTPQPPPKKKEPGVFFLKLNGDPKVWLVEPGRYTYVSSRAHLNELATAAGIPANPAEVDKNQFELLVRDRKRHD